MNSAWNAHLPILVGSALTAIAILAPLSVGLCGPELQADLQPAELSKMRSYAESQHEIVVILIRKKQFNEALLEANKIFDLKWPQTQEAVLRKDLLYFAEQFLHCGQAALGIRLLETNVKTFRDNNHRAAILKEEGYLHKSLGEGDKALQCFREAQRLERIEK